MLGFIELLRQMAIDAAPNGGTIVLGVLFVPFVGGSCLVLRNVAIRVIVSISGGRRTYDVDISTNGND